MSVREADVYKDGVRAATLRRTESATSFRYLPEYVDTGGRPIASTLPLGVEVDVVAGAVPPFFAGLLPEGRRLTALRGAIKASADDELSLLVAIGADTVGDVQIVEAGTPLAPADPIVEIDAGTPLRFGDLVGRIDAVGLPGVQDKVSGRMISVRARLGTTEAILKLDPPEFPNVVLNEAYFVTIARSCRMPVVDAQVIRDVDGRPGLLVRRFDRADDSTGPRRFAVEDACQARGLWPADKYSITATDAVDALTRLCAAPKVAARDLFRQITFALLTGNGDQHAKNLAVVAARAGEYRVTPAYDLPSTLFYGDKSLALSVSGKKTGVSRRLLLQFADSIGVPERLAARIIDDLLAATGPVPDEITAGALPFDASTTDAVVKELRYRRRLLAA